MLGIFFSLWVSSASESQRIGYVRYTDVKYNFETRLVVHFTPTAMTDVYQVFYIY